jgi:hypothetical protein
MPSKYHHENSPIYLNGTDIPHNKHSYIDYSTVTPENYISAAIDCVQFADCSAMEKIIANGLKVKQRTMA